MLPLAVEIGLPIEDFWGNYEYLFDVYAKAYSNRTNREAWLQGVYTLRALETSINNVMPMAVATALGGTKGKFEPIQYFNEPIDFSSSGKKKEFKPLTEDEIRQYETDEMKHFI